MLTLQEAKAAIQGKRSQRKGLDFEGKIGGFLKQRKIHYIQIPQSSRVTRDWKTGELVTRLRANRFDFIIFFSRGKFHEESYYFDTKTTKNPKLEKNYFIKKSSGIKESRQNQYELMSNDFENHGWFRCGFVIQFLDKQPIDENIRYLSIKHLKAIFKKRACVTHQDGIPFKKWLDMSLKS